MAFIRVDGHPVPVTFPVGDDGYATVSASALSLRFQYREESHYVEEEIFDSTSGALSHAIGQLSLVNDEGKFWLLKPSKFRAYGLTDSLLNASTDVLTPRESSTISVPTPMVSRIKVESGLHTIYQLSDDSDNETVRIPQGPDHSSAKSPLPSTVKHQESTPDVIQSRSTEVATPSFEGVSILHRLKKLGARKRSKNFLSHIDYSTIRTQQVKFFPPLYDGDIIFEIPPLGYREKQTATK